MIDSLVSLGRNYILSTAVRGTHRTDMPSAVEGVEADVTAELSPLGSDVYRFPLERPLYRCLNPGHRGVLAQVRGDVVWNMQVVCRLVGAATLE